MSELPLSLIQQLKQQAEAARQRRLLLLSGSARWCRQQALALLRLWPQAPSIWLGVSALAPPDALRADQAQRLLGSESELLVVDAWAGFNPNAFGQLSGTLRGGGLLLLLCPPLAQWPDYDDPEHQALTVEPYSTAAVGRRFISRCIALLQQDPDTLILRQGAEAPAALPLVRKLSPASPGFTDPVYRTAEQRQAVAVILKSVHRGRRPLVLTADRGRGKSAALGIAAAKLLEQGRDLVVTGPAPAAVAEVLQRAAANLPAAQLHGDRLQYAGRQLDYLEPDRALQQSGEGAVLLVDEAAAIPAPVLTRLLEHYPRVVFSTTVHGYEGTGRGFAVRFRQALDKRTPGWQGLHLHSPVRWADEDPLERLIFRLLLLNAEAVPADALDLQPISLARLNRDRLLADDRLLSQLFGLLVSAHYRTTPGDLRILLDSPNLHIWLVQDARRQPLATLLVAEEGPLAEDLAQAVWAGRRRPKGHLLPQTLIAQEGCLAAAPLRGGRVMRIAVHPALRRQRLGARLLQRLAEDAAALGWDYLGASFGATADLLPFWQAAGYQPVRLGHSRDAVSGTHAALVLKGLSPAGAALQRQLEQRFQQQLPLLLGRTLSDLEPELATLLITAPDRHWQLDAHDRSDLQAFTHYNRSYESCLVPLQKWLLQAAAQGRLAPLAEPEVALLVQLILQQQSWQAVAPGLGRKALMRELRQLIARLLEKPE